MAADRAGSDLWSLRVPGGAVMHPLLLTLAVLAFFSGVAVLTTPFPKKWTYLGLLVMFVFLFMASLLIVTPM